MVPTDKNDSVEEAVVAWIYQLNRARVTRGEKVTLDDVTLSFLPGAKIGVVGPNGAGKSTLLRVMAGLERPSNGDARPAPDISVGWLPQEPVLDEYKTVLGTVRDGVADTEAMLARYTEITTRLAHDDDL
jgi:ATPase subunit of ABC transporter with duplicated ATPase domains